MSQEEVINVLKNGGWMTTIELTKFCECSYHNVTRAINKLYSQGLLFMKFDRENKINRYKLKEA